MSKINIVVRLQHWMDSVPGQTFLNYAYSWGASIVILGALFKLTHLPGGNFMLFMGMGTEVVVFFLYGQQEACADYPGLFVGHHADSGAFLHLYHSVRHRMDSASALCADDRFPGISRIEDQIQELFPDFDILAGFHRLLLQCRLCAEQCDGASPEGSYQRAPGIG